MIRHEKPDDSNPGYLSVYLWYIYYLAGVTKKMSLNNLSSIPTGVFTMGCFLLVWLLYSSNTHQPPKISPTLDEKYSPRKGSPELETLQKVAITPGAVSPDTPTTPEKTTSDSTGSRDSHSKQGVPSGTPHEVPSHELPERVINGVKSFLIFVGHAQSGHSIVASILDSHPHIVVTHELNLFHKMGDNPQWTKSDIFNAIWKQSVTTSGSGLRMAHHKGYTLAIHGLYQGTYDSYIDVIGDKKGGTNAQLLVVRPKFWERIYNQLKSIAPVKVFHVIRNPFDNIVTSAFFAATGFNGTEVTYLKKNGYNHSIDAKYVDPQISQYFMLYKAIEDARTKFDLDMIQIHGKDLVADPRKIIKELCDFLQVTCDNHFLTVCSNKIFLAESKTRYRLYWKDYQIKRVRNNIKKFSTLQRYLDFDS